MKLRSSIARYIRRCGYAMVITLATGTLLPAQETVIEYLTHAGGMPTEVASQAAYNITLDVAPPDTSGVTPWGTGEGSNSIIDHIQNKDGAIMGWCPWRNIYGSPNHNYEIFVPNQPAGTRYTQALTSNSITYIANAIRPTIQNESGLNGFHGGMVQEISYVGARSLMPSETDSSQFSYYTEEDIANSILTEKGLPVKNKFYAVYGEDGEQLTNAEGLKLYTDRTANQYYTRVYANDEDETGSLAALNTHADIQSGRVGDDYNGSGRTEIAATSTPVDVYNNKLVIKFSGFALAMGAYSQYGDVYNNATYIQDVRVSDDVIGAGAYDGDCHNNSLVVIRAQAIGQNTTLADELAGVHSSNYNNSGKIAGVYSASKVTNDATNNSVFVYGASVYQDVTGAYTGGNAIGNTVFITRSNISTGLSDVDQSMAGYSLRTGTAENNVFIVDDTFDVDAAGVEPEDESVTSGAAGGKTASVPDVTTVHEDIWGGGTSRAYGDNGAHNNKVVVQGITTQSTEAGHEGESVTTAIEGNIFGGVVLNNSHNAEGVDFSAPAASATGNTVVVSDAVLRNYSSVPILNGRGTTDNIWGEKIVSTDVGRICGGYVGAPKDGRAPGNANDNKVIVMNSKVTNSIFGGSNEGAGQANGNELHLSHVDTTGTGGDHSYQYHIFYGGYIASYESGGQANNNNVWLYDSGWSMNDTSLHGGYGNELVKDDAGDIVWADGTVKIKGAQSFDGTNFYGADKNVLATLELSKLVRNNANGTTTNIFSNVTAFDGANFFDEDRNNTGTFEQMSIMKISNSADIMRAVTDISKVREDGSVDFYTEDASGQVATVATWHATGEHAGKIIGLDNSTIASGIASYDEESETFFNASGTAIYKVVRGTIVKGSTVMAQGITSYEFDDQTGNLEFKDSDGNVLATFVSSTIIGSDAEGNAVNIDIPDKEVDKNGIHMVRRGNVSELLAKLEGYEKYAAYTKGNWLHLAGFQGNLRNFDHFEGLHIILTPEIDRSIPVLTITGPQTESSLTCVKEEGADPTPIQVKVDVSPIVSTLRAGDVIPIIAHDEHDQITNLNTLPVEVVGLETPERIGVTRTVTRNVDFFEVDNEDQNTDNDASADYSRFGVIKVTKVVNKTTPEAKALVEGRIAELALNNQAGDLVADQAVDSACRMMETPANQQNTYVPVDQGGKNGVTWVPKEVELPGRHLFFAMSGGHSRVNSGSHVNVDGVNALVGISQGLLEKQALTLGAFMETGWGQYTTHNSFSTVGEVRGTGESDYVGGGALMRYQLSHLGKSLAGFSLDASLRGGSQRLDFSSFDLRDAQGNVAAYDLNSTYIAGHAGINYNFKATDRVTALLYARYLWTHIDDDDAFVCGEQVSFEDMSSNRLRVGGRATWQLNENWQPYAGLAYEWEISGSARAATYGLGITSPSMRGGSVIGEIGVIWQPDATRPLWIEGGVQGSLGKRDGYSGKLGCTIAF